MKIKTSELTGAALDWAVAKCEGFTSEYEVDVGDFWIERTNHTYTGLAPFGYLKEALHFSTDWAQGGPILEREGISTTPAGDFGVGGKLNICGWNAKAAIALDDLTQDTNWHDGDTPLIAAMRCYVASKLGDEVEIPGELL